jgi:hypothetical protein
MRVLLSRGQSKFVCLNYWFDLFILQLEQYRRWFFRESNPSPFGPPVNINILCALSFPKQSAAFLHKRLWNSPRRKLRVIMIPIGKDVSPVPSRVQLPAVLE